MSDIKFNCQHCKQSLEAQEEMLGQTINCPKCNGAIQLPTRSQPPLPPMTIAINKTPSQQSGQNTKNCPFCGEQILEIAIKCKHCGEMLNQNDTAGKPNAETTIKKKTSLLTWIATIIAVIWLVGYIVRLNNEYNSSSSTQYAAQMVKDGILKIDNSKTIGQAFEGYQYFKKKEWQTFETSQGTILVQFTGEMNLDEYVNTFAQGMFLSLDLITKAKRTLLGVNYDIHFALSKTDNSFQIKSASIKMKVKNQETGIETEKEVADSNQAILETIYKNAPDIVTMIALVGCSQQ